LGAEFPSEEKVLRANGDEAKLVIQKAYSILFRANIFASKGVGIGGTPTASSWALTVIVRYDPEAVARLETAYRSTYPPVVKLYCLVGVFALDQTAGKRLAEDPIAVSLMATEINTLDGCIAWARPFGDCLAGVLKGDTKRYFFEELPSIYKTCDP
jgi:hypothetical protein